MKMNELRTLAKKLSINSFGKTKMVLVREIQLAEGNFPCFATVKDYCDQTGCMFREACFTEAEKLQKKSAPTDSPANGQEK